MLEILNYLKTHGERLDTEIAEATGITFAEAQGLLAMLSAQGEVMSCHSIKFVKGKKIEGTSYRISGFIPRAKPGAKSKVQLKLS